MKLSPKCRTKKLGMIYTILGSLCSFLNWEGAYIWPQISQGKYLGVGILGSRGLEILWPTCLNWSYFIQDKLKISAYDNFTFNSIFQPVHLSRKNNMQFNINYIVTVQPFLYLFILMSDITYP